MQQIYVLNTASNNNKILQQPQLINMQTIGQSAVFQPSIQSSQHQQQQTIQVTGMNHNNQQGHFQQHQNVIVLQTPNQHIHHGTSLVSTKIMNTIPIYLCNGRQQLQSQQTQTQTQTQPQPQYVLLNNNNLYNNFNMNLNMNMNGINNNCINNISINNNLNNNHSVISGMGSATSFVNQHQQINHIESTPLINNNLLIKGNISNQKSTR